MRSFIHNWDVADAIAKPTSVLCSLSLGIAASGYIIGFAKHLGTCVQHPSSFIPNHPNIFNARPHAWKQRIVGLPHV